MPWYKHISRLPYLLSTGCAGQNGDGLIEIMHLSSSGREPYTSSVDTYRNFLSFLETVPSGSSHAAFAAVQHHGCSQYVGLYKDFRVLDTAVYMTDSAAKCTTRSISFSCKDLRDGCACRRYLPLQMYSSADSPTSFRFSRLRDRFSLVFPP